MKKTLLGFALVGALLAGGFGIAQATIPSADGTIHGCYKTSTGDLKIIDGDTATCANGYTALDWNQTGPAGPAGPAGSSGYQVVVQTVPDGTEFVQVDCPTGKFAVDQWGFVVGSRVPDYHVSGAVVDAANRITGVIFQPHEPGTFSFEANVICVNG